MKFYTNDGQWNKSHRRISKAEAVELFGKSTMENRIEEAKVAYCSDPHEEQSWGDGLLIVVAVDFEDEEE